VAPVPESVPPVLTLLVVIVGPKPAVQVVLGVLVMTKKPMVLPVLQAANAVQDIV